MATIKYKGMEIQSITECKVYEKPQEMLVWNTSYEGPIEKMVCAIIPYRHAGSVITTSGAYEYCAEIPKKSAPRRATNRELAKWLAQCNGEMTFKYKSESDTDHLVFTSHCYEEEYADEECDKALKRDDDGSWIVVRKWDDTEWHEPDVEYMGLVE